MNTPKARPTPAINPMERRKVSLTNCEVKLIVQIAAVQTENIQKVQKYSYDPKVVCQEVSSLSSDEISECIRDMYRQKPATFELCCTEHEYNLTEKDITSIRKLIFDHEHQMAVVVKRATLGRFQEQNLIRINQQCRSIMAKLRKPIV